MAYTDDELNEIFDKNNGQCHICCGREGRLAFSNYGCFGERGAWEVSHRKSVACGGSDSMRNKLPAHISCNRSNGAECRVAPRHHHSERGGLCCTKCRANRHTNGHAVTRQTGARSSGRRCAARLAADGRMKCSRSARGGSRFCGLHAYWRRGSF